MSGSEGEGHSSASGKNLFMAKHGYHLSYIGSLQARSFFLHGS
jgi:hypothetical protein